MIKYLTLNLRHNLDRWDERFPLVVDAIHQQQPDVIAFQEVHTDIQQAEIIAEQLQARTPNKPYSIRTTSRPYKGYIEANALLSRLPIVSDERIELPMEGGRSAQRITVQTDSNHHLNIANVHLHHLPMFEEDNRLPQMQALLKWMFAFDDKNWLLAGDMNALPESKTIAEAQKHLKNAYYETHDTYPLTFPTPLTQGKYGDTVVTLDYIFYHARSLNVISAKRFADVGADETLYPSDHYGLVAEFDFVN